MKRPLLYHVLRQSRSVFVVLCLLAVMLLVGAQGIPRATAATSDELPPGTLSWDDAEPGKDYVRDELVVGFKTSLFSVPADNPIALSPDQITQLHSELKTQAAALTQAYGYQVRDTSPAIPVALVRLPPTTTPLAAMAALQNDPRVAFAEPNQISTIDQTTPSDPCWSDDTDLCFDLQKAHFTDVGAQRGWDTLPLDYTVRIAVIDSGFHFEHPDKWYDVSQIEDRDFVSLGLSYVDPCTFNTFPRDWDLAGYDNDAQQMMDLEIDSFSLCLEGSDSGSHGTKVTGVIASAWENDEGGAGTVGRIHQAPSGIATIIPIQALDVAGSGTAFDTAQAILYAGGLPASNGHGGVVGMPRADIVNMSFASFFPSALQQAAVGLANLNGALLIAAVGNDAVPLPTFPAWYPDVISVSAIDTSENLASFSNSGKVDVTAPGVSVYTTGYDYSSCALVAVVPCVAATGGAPNYASTNGTSFAAPHVTGIAALYKAHNDFATNVQLRQMLFDYAADWGIPGSDPLFGNGLVQAAPGRGVALVTDWGPMAAYLVDKTTGAVRSTSANALTGDFQFLNVPAGEYFLLAARDTDEDGIFGETGEAVGAGGGGGALQNAQTRSWPGGNMNGTINFALGWPGTEPELANNTYTGASATFVGLYAEASYLPISGTVEIDWFRFRVPSDGNYRIWTEGRNTIECREEFNEMDPMITLYGDPKLPPLAQDSNSGEGNCAEIPSYFLTTGQWYFVAVESEGAAPEIGFATILHIDGP